MPRKKPTPPTPEPETIEARVIPPAAQQTVEVPAEMILQLATGMEDEFAVAERFGFDVARYTQLLAWKPFQAQLDTKRTELNATGVTFRMKAQFMATDLADEVYRKAKRIDATMAQQLEAFKTFTKLADYEPKPNATVSQGPAFSISINVTQAAPAKEITLEGKPGGSLHQDSQTIVLEPLQGPGKAVEALEPRSEVDVQRDVQLPDQQPVLLPASNAA